jgi:hypothetical protein
MLGSCSTFGTTPRVSKLSKIQSVNIVPDDPTLPSLSPKAPDELLWSKSLKGWVMKLPFGDFGTLPDGAIVRPPDGKLKPLSKIAQRAKGQKDLRKLERAGRERFTDHSPSTFGFLARRREYTRRFRRIITSRKRRHPA